MNLFLAILLENFDDIDISGSDEESLLQVVKDKAKEFIMKQWEKIKGKDRSIAIARLENPFDAIPEPESSKAGPF